MLPFVYEYYPESSSKLTFYNEMYNLDKLLGEGEDFLVVYSIQGYASGETIGNYSRFAKQKASTINVLLGSFDIQELATGSYKLSVEVRNQKNELVLSKTNEFQRQTSKVAVKEFAARVKFLFVSYKGDYSFN